MESILKETPLFHDISEKEIKELLKNKKCGIRIYTKKETVAFRGESVDEILIVLKGSLNTEMQKLNGDVIKVGSIEEKEIAVSAFIYGEKNEYPVDLVVLKSAEIFYLSKTSLDLLMQEDKRIQNNFLKEISNKAQYLSEKIWFSFNNKSIEEKLIGYITSNLKGDVFSLKPSLKEVAQLFGVARPSLSRRIGEFLDEGLIERINRNTYRILNKEELYDKIN